MKKIDKYSKTYLSNPKYFSEFINSFIYGGKQIVKADELINISPYEYNDKTLKERDNLCVYMKDGVNKYCLIGIESQSYIDYTMPIRCMQYDANTLAEQYKYSKKTTTEKLIPVITLVIFLSPKKWTGRKSLKDMYLNHDPKLDKFIPSYSMNLIEPYSMSEEEIASLTDVCKQIILFEKYSNNQKKLDKIMLNKELFGEVGLDTAKFIKDITNIEINLNEGEETVDMCKAWADQKQCGITIGYNKGKDEGWNEGKIEGKIEGGIQRTIMLLKEFKVNDKDIVTRLIKDFDLSIDDATNKLNNYKA